MNLDLSRESADYPFHTRPVIRMSDLAGGMHVSNHTLLAFITEAQLQLIQALGFPKIHINGKLPINSGVEIAYKSEVAYGDKLDIGVNIESIQQQDYQLIFHVVNTDTDRLVLQARMYMNFIDIEKHCRADVPRAFIDAWQSYIINLADK